MGTNLVEPRFLPKREILFSIFRSTDVSALVEFHLWKEVQGRGRGKKKVRKKETNGSPFFFFLSQSFFFAARLIRGVKNGTVFLQEVALKP